jgi:hypothetical protein
MKIRTRKVTTSKSIDEAMRMLKSAAYYLPEGKFDQTSFSFYCARRHGGGSVMLIPVRGSLSVEDDQVSIILEIHGDFRFYVGCILSLFGILGTLCLLIMQSPSWPVGCMVILFGGIMCGSSLLTASEILDRISFKLCRRE